MSENNAVIKVVADNERVIADLQILNKQLTRERDEYRKMVLQWEAENGVLQESLDGAQREIERLSEQWELVIKRDLG